MSTELEIRLFDSLVQRWGYIVGSAGLREVLGFSSQAALRRAIDQGHLPVRVFTIPGRKGPFATAHDLAEWLSRPKGDAHPDTPDQGAPRRAKGGATGTTR